MYFSNMWQCEASYASLNHSSFFEELNYTHTWIQTRQFSSADIAIMSLCTIGIIGNLLNLLMLSAKRCLKKLQSLEDNANLILHVLAVSDLLFCIVAIVFPFTKNIPYYVRSSDVGYLLLRYYGLACNNLFLMTSTYMVVLLAVERYIAMYYPLQAKLLGKPCSTLWFIVLFVVLCVGATLPYFINNVVVPCYSTTSQEVLFECIPRWQNDDLLIGYMTTVWPALAVFIPLTIVFFCNIRLVQGLKKVTSKRKYQVTLILIVIVFLSVILVIPAEIIKLMDPYKTFGDNAFIVAHTVNAMQTANFAVNVFLYCVLDREYRQIFKTVFCCGNDSSHNTDSRNHIPMVKTSRSRITGSTKFKTNKTFV